MFTQARRTAGEPTAFELIKMGDQYIGVQSKDKVVQIRSEKSIASLTPEIWYVVYYDPDATFKAVEVKFGAGQKLDVSHPWRMLEMADDDHNVLDKTKLKIDSRPGHQDRHRAAAPEKSHAQGHATLARTRRHRPAMARQALGGQIEKP